MTDLTDSSLLVNSLPELKKIRKHRSLNKRESYYPLTGPLRRDLYAKHIGYFAAGLSHRERLFLAANRVGKTEGVGAYEVTCHLTGRYPDWWVGRRFDKPIKAWAAGDSSITVRDIMQEKMLGSKETPGTGMVPADTIVYTRPKRGVPDAIELVYVKHISGGRSLLTFKSYDQGRTSFQGTEQEVVWLDEEPPYDIYSECLTRTMTTNGLIILTFTPLQGLTKLVESFVPGGRVESGDIQVHKKKYMVPCTWEEVPHLDKDAKAELFDSYLPYERKARARGIPSLGSGVIYPVAEEDITVKPFAIPSHWPRAYGFDVGWKKTAGIWGADNPDTQTTYLYDEHYVGEAEPVIHTAAIKAKGEWIPGVIDPAAQGRSQKDGIRLMTLYQDMGLDLETANHAIHAGIHMVWTRLTAGRLKVFSSCMNWLEEFRLYRRDEDGKIVKKKDHLMDATRYLLMSGRDRMVVKMPPDVKVEPEWPYGRRRGRGSWQGK